jgi:hypothetical protein|nr:MAG TPA_asm: hypothetical protein [Caudoviricetes sp.]
MTSKTTNYNLEKYDATDSPNLQGAYNRSIDIIDMTLKAQSDKIDTIPTPEKLPDGLKAFCTALGLTNSNAGALGTALNHLLNRTPASNGGQYTVKNLNDTKVTAEGLPFVSTTSTGK